MASFEYAVNWNKHFKLRREVTRQEINDIGNNTLNYFQKYIYNLGYNSYLINRNRKSISLVPIYGIFWDDQMEICFNRKAYYGSWGQLCWNDVLIVQKIVV